MFDEPGVIVGEEGTAIRRIATRTVSNGMALFRILRLLVSASSAFAQPASELFGAMHQPTAGPEIPIGSYAKGCIAGAVQLPADGPGWQAMRPSRDRHWGTAELVHYIEALAQSAAQDGWRGILVGDIGQARGGPMKSGHASHQIGLDVDIWLQLMPDHLLSAKERESLSAISVLKAGTRDVDPRLFGEPQRLLLYRAAQLPGVGRIFVAPGIKSTVCDQLARPELPPENPALVRPRRPLSRAARLPLRHGIVC